MRSDKQRVQEILDSFYFGGLWSLVNPTFVVHEGSDLKVEGILNLPDRKTREPKQFTIILYVAKRSSRDQIRDSVIGWLHKFWEHEFYEGLFYDGKLVKDHHPGE